jgi:uncharacterized membrane protein
VYDTLLFLHMLAAFSLVAGYVVYWVIGLAGRRLERPATVALAYRPARVADIVLVPFGFIGTIVFGIWLAIYVDGYELWDTWIIAAFVLWALAAEAGRRAGVAANRARDRARELAATAPDEPDAELRMLLRSPQTLLWHGLSSLLVVLLLVDMIFKPGT